jgi:cell division protein FtsQ
MDGGRRVLRPLKEAIVGIQPSYPAFAGMPTGSLPELARAPSRSSRRARRSPRRRSLSGRFWRVLALPGLGTCLALAFLTGVGVFGAITGGQYAVFVANEGALHDLIAKAFGFGLEAVTISGERELSEKEILAAAGIGPRSSLLFLDVARVRRSLQASPLVKEASVRKLYPNRLLIEIEERQPFALWQKDGKVQIIAADGMPIDELRDSRFADLPLVVGEGANERLAEYVSLLEAAGDLRARVRAGILVAKRRWTLKMLNGVEVALPEQDPRAAVEVLAQLQRDARVLDKDVLSLDLRVKGRFIARLSEEAAHARAEIFAHKPKAKGGQT